MSWDRGEAVDPEVIFSSGLALLRVSRHGVQSQTSLQPSQAAGFPGSAIPVVSTWHSLESETHLVSLNNDSGALWDEGSGTPLRSW